MIAKCYKRGEVEPALEETVEVIGSGNTIVQALAAVESECKMRLAVEEAAEDKLASAVLLRRVTQSRWRPSSVLEEVAWAVLDRTTVVQGAHPPGLADSTMGR